MKSIVFDFDGDGSYCVHLLMLGLDKHIENF